MENPKIRFKGFTKDWEQRKLGDDLVSIHTGTNLLGSITNTGMPLIKMGNIQRGYFDTSKVEFLAENEQPDKADIANYGDFFFNTRNTLELVGKGATWMKNSGEYAFNSNIARFELRNLDTIFFNYLYNTDYMTKQIHARAMGTTSVAAIYPRTLDSVEYLAPCMKEQQKIGAYFKQLDHLITLHQRKCEQTKKLKKYMLQKMFPQNGEKVPEIRFDGFTYDWEQRKVGELLEERNEQAPMSEDYPLMAFIANQGVTQKGERYDRSALVNDETGKKYKRTEFGDFIYSSNNLETGSIGLNKYGNACISPVYSIFKSTGKAELDFLGRRFLRKDFINEMVKWRQGVVYGQWKIHETDFMKIEVRIPSVDEQKKIGLYFDSLDNLITLHQRKCDELKKMKKYMLQNMFI